MPKAEPDGTGQLSGGAPRPLGRRAEHFRIDESLTPGAIADATAMYPELAGATAAATEADGPEFCSPDCIPRIDRIPDGDNAYMANYWTAHGFALFPAVIEALRDWLTEAGMREILDPFTIARFAGQTAAASATNCMTLQIGVSAKYATGTFLRIDGSIQLLRCAPRPLISYII